jgi:hypothetical protein
MNAQEINQRTDLLALAERETTLRKSGAWYSGPCPICGGTDRFVLKATANGWRWLCRQCGDGKYHTPLDYIMQRDHVDFKTALNKLGGIAIPVGPIARMKPERPGYTMPDETWQDEALTAILDANTRLLGKSEGEPGRAYLTSRGVTPGSWYYWLLGYAIIENRPAVVIPHLAENMTVLAVKYRFLDAKDKSDRFKMRGGSKPVLYGLHHATGGETLLVVEGELNAVSIWQCNPNGVDVISTGTETLSGYARERLPQLARRYKRCAAWLDDPEHTKEVGGLLGAKLMLQSPVIDEAKYDANLMLQCGLLHGFLEQVLIWP